MSRHRPKVSPVIESMLNGALLAQMAFPGENGGRPLFQPGVLPVLPDDHALGTWVHEPIDWDSPYREDGYATRAEENDDRAP